MKLIFKQQHISITEFKPVNINNFSIITGKNGSGKTHLLNAIKEGYVEIENIDKAEIVYYNYNDFTVFSGNLLQNHHFQQRLNNWNKERQEYLNKIQSYRTKAIQAGTKGRTPVEQIIFNFAQQPNFDFDHYFGNKKDFDMLLEIKDEHNIAFKVKQNQQFFSPHFFQFIYQYLNNAKGKIDDLTYEKLKPKFIEYKDSIDTYLSEENQDLYNFLKESVQEKSIFNLSENDFESPNFFIEDIANEEKEYQLKKTLNSLNKIEAKEYNKQISYLSAEEFIEQNGLSPIEQINSVLSEYDCNGYFLYTNPNQQFLGIDKKNIKIQISLIHKEKGYNTQFEQLSSGEKTLIALSLFIHKTRKKRIIPRVLLLDEVDSSLHPSMINRLLSVLENLFIKKHGLKVILATHSPTTVALSPEDSIFVIDKNGDQKIRKEIKSSAINILTEGIATFNEEETHVGISYNIGKTDLPVLFTEGITDKIILETAWAKVYECEMPFFIQDCFDASFLGNWNGNPF